MERLRLAWRAVPVSLVAILINASLMLYLQYERSATLLHWGWYTTMLVVLAFRTASLLYAIPRLPRYESAVFLERLFYIGVLCTALGWGVAAWIFTPADSMAQQAFTIVVFAGLSAGAMSSLSSLQGALRLFILIMLVPLIGRLLVLGNNVQLLLAILIAVFTLLILINGRRQYQVLEDSLLFRFRSEALSRSLEETQLNARVGSWVWSPATDIVHGSHSFHVVFALAEGEVLHMADLLERIHQDDRELFNAFLQQIEREAESLQFEHRIVVDGETRVIYQRWTLEGKDSDRQSSGQVHALCQDVTRLKMADRLKDEFVATVSHELRTPLTSIMGALGVLRHEKLSHAANREEMLDVAYANSKRLATLINDLLDIAKLESGHLSVTMSPLCLSPVVAETVLINRAYAEKFKVQVVVDNQLPQPEPQVLADENRIIQVINNLLSNAIKFSPHEGIVTLLLEQCEGAVQICVVDQGTGIDEAFKAHIFDKFTQYQTMGSGTHQPGTGLGLSIAKSIMERMGGTIACDSTPGRGSRFCIRLPRIDTMDDFNRRKSAVN